MIDKIQNIMKKQLSSKEKTILSITIGIWGIVLIALYNWIFTKHITD